MGTWIKIVKSNFLTTLEISLRLGTIQGMFIQGSGEQCCVMINSGILWVSLWKNHHYSGYRINKKFISWKKSTLLQINFMFPPNSILFWGFRCIYRVIFEDLFKPDYCYDYYSSRMALDINIILLFFSKFIKCFISLSIAITCRIS